jgi:hypothetical protein
MTKTKKSDMPKDKAPNTIRIDVDDHLGEFYRDYLIVAARTNGSTASSTAIAYLKQAIKINQPMIRDRVQYLADRHGLTYQEMWDTLLAGKVDPIELNKEGDA